MGENYQVEVMGIMVSLCSHALGLGLWREEDNNALSASIHPSRVWHVLENDCFPSFSAFSLVLLVF